MRKEVVGSGIIKHCVSVWCWCRVCKQLHSNNINRVRWVVLGRVLWEVLGLSQDWVYLFANSSVNILKRDQSNDATFNPPLSHWLIPLRSEAGFRRQAMWFQPSEEGLTAHEQKYNQKFSYIFFKICQYQKQISVSAFRWQRDRDASQVFEKNRGHGTSRRWLSCLTVTS